MAQTGYTPISLYYTTTASAVPVNTNLVNGELAINITDGKLYYKNNSGVVTLLAGSTSGPAGGSNTQVQFNSSGVLAGSSALTWDGTTLAATKFSGALNGTVGATTPSTGAFTTLSATGNITRTIATTAGYAFITNISGYSGAYTVYADGTSTRIGNEVALPIDIQSNATTIGRFSSTGLAVTGALSATGQILSNGSGGNISGISTYTNTLALAGSSTSATTSAGIQFGDNFNASCRQWGIYNGRDSSGQSVGTLNFVVSSSVNANALANTMMTLDASGNLLVGTTSSSVTTVGILLKPVGNTTNVPLIACTGNSASSSHITWAIYSTSAGGYEYYVDYSGIVHSTQATNTLISDERLKENIRDIDTGLTAIKSLKPRIFDWKENKGANIKNATGFIAQEFETVFPDSVGTSQAGEDGIEYKNINYEKLVPTLVKAIQELSAKVAALEAK